MIFCKIKVSSKRPQDVENDDGKDEVQINQMEVLQLKDNIIPKGLIPLE